MPGAGPDGGGLLRPPASAGPGGRGAQTRTASAPHELFVRHARKEGRSVAVMRAVDYGDSCVVEAEVYPPGAPSAEPLRPGPYTFADPNQATAFVTEAVEALMFLGCDIQAQ